jgi:hypothetical protein
VVYRGFELIVLSAAALVVAAAPAKSSEGVVQAVCYPIISQHTAKEFGRPIGAQLGAAVHLPAHFEQVELRESRA